MVVIDTSALVAILQNEAQAEACTRVVEQEAQLLMSAGNAAEALIVATGRQLATEMQNLVDRLQIEIIPVTMATARRIGEIYRRWGRGFHSAGLNYGDCFAYELATSRDCPLLFVGDDFSQTDVKRALTISL